jgi:hypothetical protein
MIIGAIDDALRFYRAQLIIYFYTSWGFMVYYGFKTDPLKAFFWCFGFSTYLIIIIGVGHNSKAQPICHS